MPDQEQMSGEEYARRWRSAQRVAAWWCVQLLIAALTLSAIATYLSTHTLLTFVWFGAAGAGCAAFCAFCFAVHAGEKSGYPGRLPHTWRSYYSEPPNLEKRV